MPEFKTNGMIKSSIPTIKRRSKRFETMIKETQKLEMMIFNAEESRQGSSHARSCPRANYLNCLWELK